LEIGEYSLEGVALTASVSPEFWRERRVLLTGHTGFKGGWAALWLARMGAQVTGLALAPEAGPSLFALAGISGDTVSYIADLADRDAVAHIAAAANPDVVLHLAAQALVRRAAKRPLETFSTNVLGTVHLLDALRACPSLKAVLVVTSDKVYKNDDTGRPFRETDPLSGHEPYSASKAAQDMAARVYGDLYFEPRGIAVATARGGNVVGGGDFGEDRLVPDIVRASMADGPVTIRHPESTRPWQHVLDCLAGYLMYAEALAEKRSVPRALNFGPSSNEAITVADVVSKMLSALPGQSSWRRAEHESGVKESKLLALDSSLARASLGWSDRYRGETVLDVTAAWYRKFRDAADMRIVTLGQIDAYMKALR
jgi:CDP-glucose 4,6-dehydratase